MNDYHLVYHKGNWKLADDNSNTVEVYANRPKADAITLAYKRLRDTSSTLTIHQMNGVITDLVTFPLSSVNAAEAAAKEGNGGHPLGLWP